MTYCIHDLDPASCADCNGAARRAAEQERAALCPAGRGPWFFAKWDGKCSDCGEAFDAGQKIRSDGDGGWLDEDCGDG